MARQKNDNRAKLAESHKNFVQLCSEQEGFKMLMDLAEQSKLDSVINQAKATKARYDEDYKYLAAKRAYYLGKVIEESPTLFNKVLSEVLGD